MEAGHIVSQTITLNALDIVDATEELVSKLIIPILSTS